MADSAKDEDERRLEQLAKRVLAMPPKPQSEMKIGKRIKPAQKKRRLAANRES